MLERFQVHYNAEGMIRLRPGTSFKRGPGSSLRTDPDPRLKLVPGVNHSWEFTIPQIPSDPPTSYNQCYVKLGVWEVEMRFRPEFPRKTSVHLQLNAARSRW